MDKAVERQSPVPALSCNLYILVGHLESEETEVYFRMFTWKKGRARKKQISILNKKLGETFSFIAD